MRWCITRVRGRGLIGGALVVDDRRILRGVVLRVILTIVLWVVLAVVLRVVILRVVLAIVLLGAVIRLRLLSVPSERHPEEAPLRWWGVLIIVTLLLVLRSTGAGHISLRDPPSPAHGVSKEDTRHDHETDRRDNDACSGAQSVPADPIIEIVVVAVGIGHCGRR